MRGSADGEPIVQQLACQEGGTGPLPETLHKRFSRGENKGWYSRGELPPSTMCSEFLGSLGNQIPRIRGASLPSSVAFKEMSINLCEMVWWDISQA